MSYIELSSDEEVDDSISGGGAGQRLTRGVRIASNNRLPEKPEYRHAQRKK